MESWRSFYCRDGLYHVASARIRPHGGAFQVPYQTPTYTLPRPTGYRIDTASMVKVTVLIGGLQVELTSFRQA
jgi:hypothetical protein